MTIVTFYCPKLKNGEPWYTKNKHDLESQFLEYLLNQKDTSFL